jgi:hypothetical protein
MQNGCTRLYHSYPDPNEKPVINVTQSTHAKTYDKTLPDFKLDQKFRMENQFPGTPVSTGIGATPPPPTLTTVLDNGLTVATQDMPGMMSSIAIIVRAGRY